MPSKREKLRDKEYRASYAESFLDTSIATQIRVLREQRGWTQAELAEKAGMKQSRISALEDADYSKWSLGTLKRLARAFDVPLNVMFGTFGNLVIDVEGFNRASLERPEFDKDPAFIEGTIIAPASTTPTDAAQVQTASVSKGHLLHFPTRGQRATVAIAVGSTDSQFCAQAAAK